MCVVVVTMRGWADVGLWVALCFLAKISLHRPTCKTTFARFHHFQIKERYDFFHCSKLIFCTKLPFPLPWWSKDLLVNKLQVAGGQLRNPPVKFRHERWLHLAIDQHPECPNKARRELWPRKWFLLGRNPWRYSCTTLAKKNGHLDYVSIMGYRKIKLDCASVCSDVRSRGWPRHRANLLIMLIMLILRDKNSALILCII